MTKKTVVKNYAGCGHTINPENIDTMNLIKLQGHKGRWNVVALQPIKEGDEFFESYRGEPKVFYLCEHNTYGDEAAYIIIDRDYNIVLEDVWNGFADLEDYWACERLKEEENTNKAYQFSRFSNITSSELTPTSHLVSGEWIYSDNDEDVTYYFSVVIISENENITFFYNGTAPKEQQKFEDALLLYLA